MVLHSRGTTDLQGSERQEGAVRGHGACNTNDTQRKESHAVPRVSGIYLKTKIKQNSNVVSDIFAALDTLTVFYTGDCNFLLLEARPERSEGRLREQPPAPPRSQGEVLLYPHTLTPLLLCYVVSLHSSGLAARPWHLQAEAVEVLNRC